MSPRAVSALLLTAALLAAASAHARQSDRDQPMDIHSGHQVGGLNDGEPIIMSRGVVITQGPLEIKSDRAEVTLRGGEVDRVVLTGSPATMFQETDEGEPLNAHASRIVYDMRNDTLTMTGNALVEQPRGDMRGERIVYNLQTERVEAGGEGAGRVHMRIQPRTQRQDSN